jgi:hypothetical protein
MRAPDGEGGRGFEYVRPNSDLVLRDDVPHYRDRPLLVLQVRDPDIARERLERVAPGAIAEVEAREDDRPRQVLRQAELGLGRRNVVQEDHREVADPERVLKAAVIRCRIGTMAGRELAALEERPFSSV